MFASHYQLILFLQFATALFRLLLLSRRWRCIGLIRFLFFYLSRRFNFNFWLLTTFASCGRYLLVCFFRSGFFGNLFLISAYFFRQYLSSGKDIPTDNKKDCQKGQPFS